MNRERWKGIGAHAVGFWETARSGATYNPLSPGVIQNPYKAYARLRRRSPVHRPRKLGARGREGPRALNTESAASEHLIGAAGAVSRVRVMLEGSGSMPLGNAGM